MATAAFFLAPSGGRARRSRADRDRSPVTERRDQVWTDPNVDMEQGDWTCDVGWNVSLRDLELCVCVCGTTVSLGGAWICFIIPVFASIFLRRRVTVSWNL